MGSGRAKRSMDEIDETRQSASDDRFEEILEKVKAAGAEVARDDLDPLYSGSGEDDFEIGEQRVVEFALAGMDFIITRDVKDAKVTGHGHSRAVIDLPKPMVDIRLKRKPSNSSEWTVVDLDEFM
jgi:hypothetical protein